MKIRSSAALSVAYIFLYSVILGSGLIGFGIDVQKNYIAGKTVSFNPFDTIGVVLATLRYGTVYLGVFVTVFLLVSSVSFLYSSLLDLPLFKTSILLTPFYLSWPIILPSLNVLRQGVCTAFFLYAIIFYMNRSWSPTKKYSVCIFFLILALFSHKMGVTIFISVLGLISFDFLQIIKAPKSVILLCILTTFLLSYALLFSQLFSDYESRTVGVDLGFLTILILLGALFVFIRTFPSRSYEVNFPLALFLFNLSSVAFIAYLFGFSFQSERLAMFSIVLFIPMVIRFIRIDKKRIPSLLLLLGTTLFLLTKYLMPFYDYLGKDLA